MHRAPHRFVAIGLAMLLATPAWAFPGFAQAEDLREPRTGFGMALLSTGEVLIAGGSSATASLATVERYDSWTGVSRPAASMSVPRDSAGVVRLPSGEVLVIGGNPDGTTQLTSTERYDPVGDRWVSAAPLHTTRGGGFTTTLLLDGRVLVTGGLDQAGTAIAGVEIYDPSTDTWTVATSMNAVRTLHTASRLTSGKVLIVGGINGVPIGTVELYDPSNDTWAPVPSVSPRDYHTATVLADGRVLVTGGLFALALDTSEIYSPVTNSWTPGPTLNESRYGHSANLLPNGFVVVTSGFFISGSRLTNEYFDPGDNLWHLGAPDLIARIAQAAIVLPSGRLQVAGGANSGGILQRVDVSAPHTLLATTVTGSPLQAYRQSPTATLLATGEVLVVGGDSGLGPLASAELYSPLTQGFRFTSSSTHPHSQHTATLLPSGRVLVVGGESGTPSAAAEEFDPVAETWSDAGTFAQGRTQHTTTLLPSGQVLVAGGKAGGPLDTCFLYDPATRSWAATGSMGRARFAHTASLLPSGQVLVAGGLTTGGLEDGTSERFDPGTGTWGGEATLPALRAEHAALVLDAGRVFLFGGSQLFSALSDFAGSSWAQGSADTTVRRQAAGIRLPGGEPMIQGGFSGLITSATATIHEGLTGQGWDFPAGGPARQDYAATILEDGTVLAVGGSEGTNALQLVTRLPPPQLPALTPKISGLTQVRAHRSFTVTGDGFRGQGATDSGTYSNTSVDFPFALLEPASGAQRVPLNVTFFSPTSFTATVPAGLPVGYYRLQVGVNGAVTGRMVLLQANQLPHAENLSLVTSRDVPVALTLQGTDLDDDPATFHYSLASTPAFGTLSGISPNLIYTPKPGFLGTDVWSYVVSDPDTPSAPALVTVTVQTPPLDLSVGCSCASFGGGEWSVMLAFLTLELLLRHQRMNDRERIPGSSRPDPRPPPRSR